MNSACYYPWHCVLLSFIAKRKIIVRSSLETQLGHAHQTTADHKIWVLFDFSCSSEDFKLVQLIADFRVLIWCFQHELSLFQSLCVNIQPLQKHTASFFILQVTWKSWMLNCYIYYRRLIIFLEYALQSFTGNSFIFQFKNLSRSFFFLKFVL